jgi:hypothetical protein
MIMIAMDESKFVKLLAKSGSLPHVTVPGIGQVQISAKVVTTSRTVEHSLQDSFPHRRYSLLKESLTITRPKFIE